MEFIEFLKAVLIGIVEGVTEWLPVSSTGHMILLDELINMDIRDEFYSLFLVVIQLGAIIAVPILFFDKLNPFSDKHAPKSVTLSLWLKVIVGSVPAAVLGVLLDDILDAYLYRYYVVAIALVVYGIAFILVEKLSAKRTYRVESVYDLGYTDALKIGCFQVLSLVPGTSRSGSTILGGMITGVSRTASAEFSFFMAIPIMLGASLLKIAKFVFEGNSASGGEILILITGMLVSFAVSVVAIRFLMSFVKRHSFSAFGIYRILLGTLVLIYFIAKK